MTPKEKAEELLKSMLKAEDLFGNYPMCHDTAKHCALVCCDEILGLFTRAGSAGLSMADVTFLCDVKSIGYEVVKKLGMKGIRCVHTYDPDEKESRRQKVGFYMGDARVKATTLHSFKGWEARILVIYLERGTTPQALSLLYTGLTRIKRHTEGSFLTVISKDPQLKSYGETWPDFVQLQ